MENNGETIVETPAVEKLPMRHQLGKLFVGSIAAFVANQAAESAYDAALRYYRARKSA